MSFQELLASRRSCRKFSDMTVDEKTVEALLKATLSAPSSKNCRSTRLAVVRDRDLLEKISLMRTSGSSFVKDAPLAIMVMADESLTDLWVDNCAISATVLQLAAEDMGLGSCWVHVAGRPHDNDEPSGMSAEEYLHGIMPSSGPYRIECVVALGYPAEPTRPHGQRDDSDKIISVP